MDLLLLLWARLPGSDVEVSVLDRIKSVDSSRLLDAEFVLFPVMVLTARLKGGGAGLGSMGTIRPPAVTR